MNEEGRVVGLGCPSTSVTRCACNPVSVSTDSTWAAGLAMDGSAELNRLQAKKRESGQPLVPFGRFRRAE